jgi:hypothetical protein
MSEGKSQPMTCGPLAEFTAEERKAQLDESIECFVAHGGYRVETLRRPPNERNR